MLIRWWTIGATIEHVLPNFEKWAAISFKRADAYPLIAAPNKCASAITLLLSEPSIKAQLHWIDGFHKILWKQHFAWLSAVDETSGEASFRSHHIAAHTSTMGRELKYLAETWINCPKFSAYLKQKEKVTMDYDQKYLKELEMQFFVIAQNTFNKYFKQ